MAGDHLDNEVSASAEVTPTGVNAKAKSRLVSAIDRLGGGLVDWVNARLERGTSRVRVTTEGERQLIEAAAKYGIDKMGKEPEFAQRALENHFRGIFTAQENKDAVLERAIDDLRLEPPRQAQAEAGQDELGDEFVRRLDNYAKDATTEELREKWGRVLASEIRAPGTFSIKVLRVVDEMDGETAKLFERICAVRIENTILKPLISDDLSFNEVTQLTAAGLVLEPGLMGHTRLGMEVTDNQGRKLLFWDFGSHGVAIQRDISEISKTFRDAIVFKSDNRPAIPTYLLTEVGHKVSSILPNFEERSIIALARTLATGFPGTPVTRYQRQPDGNWSQIDRIG